MTARPKILFVTSHRPGDRTGFGFRVGHTLAGLRQIGHVHTLLLDVSADGDGWIDAEATVVSATPASVARGYLRSARTGVPREAAYDNLDQLRERVAPVLAGGWDLVWIFRCRPFSVVDGKVDRRRIVVDFDDLYDLHYSSLVEDSFSTSWKGRMAWPIGWRLDARQWARHQRSVAQRVATALVVSQEDADHLGVDNAEMLPNGFDVMPVTECRASPSPCMLFVGGYHYRPNLSAAYELSTEILPRVKTHHPEAEVLLVGGMPAHHRHLGDIDGVTVADHVSDLDPFFARADMVVTPIRSGGGSRLKAVEAMSRGIPLVSTSLGVRGFNVVDGDQALIAETVTEFAHAVSYLSSDRELRRRLVAQARAHFIGHYSSDVVTARVVELASGAIARGTAARNACL